MNQIKLKTRLNYNIGNMDYEVVIKKYEEKYEKEVCDLVIKAWTPLREVARGELGDKIYDTIFSDWQDKKCKGVIDEMKSTDSYVAIIEDKLVGFIYYKVNGKVGVIGENAVSPGYKGRGIAQKLYKVVLDKMKEQGAEIATVYTGLDDGHAPARKAYEKAGFKENLKHISYYKVL